MDVSLVAAVVGTAAAVVAVPIAILQLRQGRRGRRKLEVSERRDSLLPDEPASVVQQAARAVLPPPLGLLPLHVRGRNTVLGELTELGKRPDGRIHVLAGLGGAGKSTVALAVTQNVAAAGLRTWWVAAAPDPGSVAQRLLGLAQRLGAPAGEVDQALAGRMHPADVLWPRLEAAPGWVLVFDNVDDPGALATAGRPAGEAAGWLRPTRAGLILVTSRIGDLRIWGPMARVHRVGSLEDADGAQVLLDLAPDAGDSEEAARLSARLGGLPLALHQAGTYLASPFAAHRTFADYHRALQERFGQLLGRGDEDRVRVTGTWELSLTALAAQGYPQARSLLRVLSCFAPATPIPAELLDARVLGRHCGGIAKAEEGLSGLLATGLIEGRGKPPPIAVHPLVAETTRQRAGSALITSFRQAIELVNAAAAQLADDDPVGREKWLAILPHLRFLFTLDVNADATVLTMLAQTAARASRALSWAGSYFPAFEIADAALSRLAGVAEDSTDVLTLRFQRAIASQYLGHYAEAEAELRHVLAARQRLLGADHPDSLTTQHYIAATLAHQGKLSEADRLFQLVLAKRLELLDPDHPHTLSTRHWIAAVAARQGMPNQAETESRKVLDARQRTLGGEHPSTLATWHDVARYLAEQGRHAEAETMFRQILDAKSRVLASDHPRTLETQYELAASLVHQGKANDARSILEDVLRSQTDILGPGHPDTLRTATLLNHLQQQGTQQAPTKSRRFRKTRP
jgi:tetratricopeptide (TPR) repeat protein